MQATDAVPWENAEPPVRSSREPSPISLSRTRDRVDLPGLMSATKGPAPRLPDKLAERLTERPGLPHHDRWTEGTELEPPRRQLPAGHVIVVMAVGLLVGAFLNAPGLLDTAKSQPFDSFRRESSLFFTRPLEAVSGFLQISRPYDLLQSALGHDDPGTTSRALPAPTTTLVPNTAAPTTTAPPRAITAERPLRMWVGGDSLSFNVGQSLINAAAATGVIRAVGPVDVQEARGLARPGLFNWPAHLAAVTPGVDPEVVVFMMGANDDQSVANTNDDPVAAFGSEQWRTEYRSRVGGLMDQVVGEGRTMVWVGVPPINNEERNARYRTINDIYRTEAAKRAKVRYVDAYSLFSTLDGSYTDFVACNGGESTRVREPDQIHLNGAGGDCLSTAILDKVDGLWHFRDSPNGGPG